VLDQALTEYGAFDWMKGLWAGLAERRRK